MSAIDPLGVSVPLASMNAACKSAFPDYNGLVNLGYKGKTIEGPLKTFHWEGVHWTLGIFLGRLLWVSMAAAIVLIAASFFDRFDPARKGRKGRSPTGPPLVDIELKTDSPTPAQVHLTPMLSLRTHLNFGRVLYAELRLILKDTSMVVCAHGRIDHCQCVYATRCCSPVVAARNMDLAIADLVGNGHT